MAATKTKAEAMASVRAIIDRYHVIAKKLNYQSFDFKLMNDLRLIDAEPSGSLVWELEITSDWSNFNGVMHGGAAGVIFDMCTATALGPISTPGYWDFFGGVSRTLNISYLKAVPVGTVMRIVAHVVQHGRTMAMIRGAMVSQDGKITYATCEHHIVSVPTLETHMATKIVKEESRRSRL